MSRVLFLTTVLLSALAAAKPKAKVVELRTLPTSPRAIALALKTEKPGPVHDSLFWSLEEKLRERGTEPTSPESVDAVVDILLGRIFDELAAPTDVWTWTGDDAPRGDLLIRKSLKLFPGRTTAGFTKSYTVSPKGKRIDRGYLNTPCTVEVTAAGSEADWHAWVEKTGWGASIHPVLESEDVLRLALTLYSPGKLDAPTPKHERPVWVAYFRRENATTPWEMMEWASPTALTQKGQEANILPADGKPKLTEQMKKLILALRMEDVRRINPARTSFIGKEALWFTLYGLTEPPVDKTTVGWLDVYRTDANPLVRAAAVLKAQSLGGTVEAAEVAEVLTSSKVTSVAVEAASALTRMLEATTEAVTDEDKDALVKLASSDDIKILKGFARVKTKGRVTFWRKGEVGWAQLK
jgi:hypothetical protein